MADVFRDRERGFEAKFKLDQELRFKAESRRSKLFGLWAASLMGLGKAEADAYVREVIRADLHEPGADDVLRKVKADLTARGIAIADDKLAAELARMHEEAAKQVLAESGKG